MTNPSKNDFSGVTGSVDSTARQVGADFSGVTATVDTTAEKVGDLVPTERTYTVERGDTLSHIAKQFYGKAGAWNAIFAANRDQLDDPDLIKPGQVLRIPHGEDDPDGSR